MGIVLNGLLVVHGMVSLSIQYSTSGSIDSRLERVPTGADSYHRGLQSHRRGKYSPSEEERCVGIGLSSDTRSPLSRPCWRQASFSHARM